jgi:hypothetical protein
MNSIQFPRAAIHQRSLLRVPRASNEKFRPAKEDSTEFCKISADPRAPIDRGRALWPERESRCSDPQRSQPGKADLLQA